MFTSRPERLVSLPGKDGMTQSTHEERLTVPLLKPLEQRDGQGRRVLDLGFGAVPQVLPSFYSLPQVASKKGTRDLCEDTSSLLVPRAALAPAKNCRPLQFRFGTNVPKT